MRSLLIVLTVLVAGCAGGNDSTPGSPTATAPVSRGANGDCIRAWNAAGNASNRSAAAEKHGGWPVSVREFLLDHPRTDLTGEGCSYFFYSPKRWKSYGGTWEAVGDLRWGTPATVGGQRTPEQTIEPANAVAKSDGTLSVIPIHRGGRLTDREWKTVIDDWFDNGNVDRPHRCVAVRKAIERLPASMPNYSSLFEDLRRYAEVVCKPGSPS